MRERYQMYIGLGLILIILGSGVLVSFVLLKADRAQISEMEWEEVESQLSSIREASLATTSVAGAYSPASEEKRLNINIASQEDLETLPGIGPARAEAIIAARQSGAFRDVDDLRSRVPKIPKTVLEDISQKISFE